MLQKRIEPLPELQDPAERLNAADLPASELIRIALADVEKCEKDERYHINMDFWHYPFTDKQCNVCFAGAVISQSLGVSHRDNVGPQDFESPLSPSLKDRLLALDSLRAGLIHTGLGLMGVLRKEIKAGIPATSA